MDNNLTFLPAQAMIVKTINLQKHMNVPYENMRINWSQIAE